MKFELKLDFAFPRVQKKAKNILTSTCSKNVALSFKKNLSIQNQDILLLYTLIYFFFKKNQIWPINHIFNQHCRFLPNFQNFWSGFSTNRPWKNAWKFLEKQWQCVIFKKVKRQLFTNTLYNILLKKNFKKN